MGKENGKCASMAGANAAPGANSTSPSTPIPEEALCVELTENSVPDAAMPPGPLESIPEAISQVGADGSYDRETCYQAIAASQAEAVIPPRRDAKIRFHGNRRGPEHPRDTNLRLIRRHGRARWKRERDCHLRSLVETFMRRHKGTLGNTLRSRTLPNQRTEAHIGVAILNYAILNRLNLNPQFQGGLNQRFYKTEFSCKFMQQSPS